MERGALGSEIDGNPAVRRMIWSQEDLRFLNVFMASTYLVQILHCGMLNL